MKETQVHKRLLPVAITLVLIAAAIAVWLALRNRPEAEPGMESARPGGVGREEGGALAERGGLPGRTGGSVIPEAAPQAGAAEPGKPGPHGAAVRVWGRVVDRESRTPVACFLVGFLANEPGRPFRIPQFNLFGAWDEIKAAFMGVPGTRKIASSDGIFEADPAAARNAMLIIVAENRPILAVCGNPFEQPDQSGTAESGTGEFRNPTFEMGAAKGFTLVAKDAKTELPLEGVEASAWSNRRCDCDSGRIQPGNGNFQTDFTFGTAIRSDAEGRIRIPSSVEFARRDSDTGEWKTSTPPMLAALLLRKQGYGMKTWAGPASRETEEETVMLYPDAGTLNVAVEDEEGHPCPAFLAVFGPGLGLDFEALEFATDGQGKCTIRDLPPGRIQITASCLPGELKGKHEPGKPLPGGSIEDMDPYPSASGSVEIPPGGTESIVLRLTGDFDDASESSTLFGKVDQASELTTLALHWVWDRGSGMIGIGFQPGEYETRIPAYGKVRIQAQFSLQNPPVSLFSDLGEMHLEKGKRHRLDLACPPGESIFKLSGTVRGTGREGQLFPGFILIQLVKAAGQVRTDGLRIGNSISNVPLAPGTAFEGWLAPGTYVIHGQYTTPKGFQITLRLGTAELMKSAGDFAVNVPWVSMLDVRATEAETGKPPKSWVVWAVWKAGTKPSDSTNLASHWIITPGEYEIIICSQGRLPRRTTFKAGESETRTEVKVELRSGEAGVIAGKVLGRKNGRPVPADISLTHEGFDLSFPQTSCPDGRFRITGLPAGEYLVEVYPENGEPGESRVTLAEDKPIADLMLEVYEE